MSLTPGTRLGPYEITAAIGAGGMGEVFRARDTKLNRDVAIKVLPSAFADDPERLARFTREAQTLASLNHPNIATIYGIEEVQAAEGGSGISSRALVMELVEGEDLSAHIARGAIPLAEALPIARQIAEALEAAHEQGIVHRDLKPANIKVRADGTVKVLDFGLAKAMDAGGATNSALSQSPTMSRNMTEAGMIIGTAAYMSPEQARGKSVDKRADIWAFGVVLFEMLTGSRAFEAEDVSLTLSKVLQLDPDFDRLPPSVPARVAQVLRVCLRKDPKQRVADIRDARLALDGAFETAAPQGAAAPSIPPARLPWIVAALAVILGAALSGWVYLRASRSAEDGPIIRFNIDVEAVSLAISPDGSRLVGSHTFRSGGLWLRLMGQVDLLTLKGTEGAGAPFWSPDGSAIGYFEGGIVKKVDLLGTPPQTLCEYPVRGAFGGAWSREGVILLGGDNGPIHRVSASGGPTQPATELDRSGGETAHLYPQFLADGRRFLYLAVTVDPKNSGIMLGALDSKTRKFVMASGRRAVFAPPRHLLFLRDDTLMAQEVHPDSLDLRGEPRPVAERVSTMGGHSVSASDNGILVLRSSNIADQSRQMSIVDRKGDLIEAFGAPAYYQNPTLSSDQKRVAFNRADQNQDIWITDLVRRTTSRLTFDPGVDDYPIWSPDGERIIFSSNRDGGVFNLYEKAGGSNAEEGLLLKNSQPKWATDWSKDGRYVVYSEMDATTGLDIWLLPRPGDQAPIEYLRTPFNEIQARVSPDGRWVAYASNESGRNEVYVQSFPKPGRKWQISVNGGEQPQWRHDGRELFYLSPTADNQFMAVDILHPPGSGGLDVSAPKELFVINVVTGVMPGGQQVQRNSYEVWNDGQRLLLNSSRAADTAPSVTVVLNWAAGLRK